MWLLHTADHRLEDFPEREAPNYAILSHTWATDEVTFKDIQNLDIAKSRKGWDKIYASCRLAHLDGHLWIWIDTCCIDKSSSAELSEAINSMWRYYSQAQICYVYLSDVSVPDGPPLNSRLLVDDDLNVPEIRNGILPKFAASRWFTRGWTLQELLAPNEVIFFSEDWLPMGRKKELVATLEQITGIDRDYLDDISLRGASIAEKMSWASRRRTTRLEDMAYCLLGIFDVNMPLLYGEGKKAFKRLQLELIRMSVDQSIFAWKCPPGENCRVEERESVLALSPSWFADSGNIIDDTSTHGISPSTITNAGIQLRLQTRPLPMIKISTEFDRPSPRADLRVIMLACTRMKGNSVREQVGVCIETTGTIREREVAKKGKAIGDFIKHAKRVFPDYLFGDQNASNDSFHTIYLRYQ